jgi:N-acetylglucosaminyldiphosphoundecaprenol N-acetyl-beta-D-mannosaminyltransferase
MSFAELSQNRSVVLGVPVDAVSLQQAIATVDEAVAARRRLFISTPNMSFFTNALNNQAFGKSLFASDLCLADGAPVIWLASLLGVSLPERVAGSDLFDALRRRASAGSSGPIKVYFFGGAEGVARAACDRINANATGVLCVGAHYPGFCSVEEMSDAETISRINSSGADLLVVAVGLVRGQEWIVKNRQRITVPVVIYLGAVINFEAGLVSRAPVAFRKFGLEWLWRIKEEPQLAGRYAADFMTLIRLIVWGAVPNIFHSIVHGVGSREDCSIVIDAKGERFQVEIRGSARSASVGKIKAAFREALGSGTSVTLACGQLRSIDAAALGQVALLWKALHERGQSITVTGLQGYPLRFFKLSGFGPIMGG